MMEVMILMVQVKNMSLIGMSQDLVKKNRQLTSNLNLQMLMAYQWGKKRIQSVLIYLIESISNQVRRKDFLKDSILNKKLKLNENL
jgi:hypothetical protein